MNGVGKTLFVLTGLLGVCAGAQADVVQGRLELNWGDPIPQASGKAQVHSHFNATLVTDDGQRLALDADQARVAADDLYALSGQRVAAELGTAAKSGGLLPVEAIVPIGAAKASEKIAGTTVWVTLMCKFKDIATEQKDITFFRNQYGTSVGQLGHYWREVSYNKINLTGSQAYGWFTLPQPRSFYFNSNGSANLGQLFTDCTNAADASVNFAVNGGVQGINMMFNGDLDGFAWGGGRCATLDGINKCWSSTWNPPWSFNNLAPLAHEMGHGYGLPHANNSDGDNDPYDNPWDVMSDAWNNAVADATYGTRAKHLSTYSRDRLAWIDAARKVTVSAGSNRLNVTLDRASLIGSTQTQMIVVTLPGQPASRYYTIESRKRGGDYEAKLAGDAVIIHRVDTTAGTPAFSVDATVPPADRANNEGSMFRTGETWTAPDNAFRVRVLGASTYGFRVSVCGPKPASGTDTCLSVN